MGALSAKQDTANSGLIVRTVGTLSPAAFVRVLSAVATLFSPTAGS